MSLINQMLRDLDKRHALDQDKTRLPDTVRAAMQNESSTNRLGALGAHKGVLAFAGVAALVYFGLQQLPDKTPVPAPDAATALPSMPEVLPAPAPIALQPAMELALASAPAPVPESQGNGVSVLGDDVTIPPASAKTAPRLRATASLGPSLKVANAPDMGGSKIIDRQPAQDDADVRLQRQYREALVMMNKGQLREAMQALYAIVRERPTHDASWQILVRLLLEQQRSNEAMQVLSEIAAVRPGYLPVVMQLARLQAEYASEATALRTLLEQRAAASGDADYVGFIATLAQRQKQFGLAASEFRQALVLRPSEGRWWVGLGLAEEAQGREAEAVAAWRKALSAGQIDAALRLFAERKLAAY